MGNALIALGIFVWFGFSMISFVFLTPWSDNLGKRLNNSVLPTLKNKTGPEWGIHLMQMIGIFWIVTGLIINQIGESFLTGIRGDIVLGIIFLAPIWIGLTSLKGGGTKVPKSLL